MNTDETSLNASGTVFDSRIGGVVEYRTVRDFIFVGDESEPREGHTLASGAGGGELRITPSVCSYPNEMQLEIKPAGASAFGKPRCEDLWGFS